MNTNTAVTEFETIGEAEDYMRVVDKFYTGYEVVSGPTRSSSGKWAVEVGVVLDAE